MREDERGFLHPDAASAKQFRNAVIERAGGALMMQEVKKQAIIKKLDAGLGNAHVGIEVSLWDVLETAKFREGDTVEVQIRRLKRPMAKERERRVIKMPKTKQRYEIKEEGSIFVGYVSGFPCVLASKREIVARMLADRFMGDVEKGEIIPFPKRG